MTRVAIIGTEPCGLSMINTFKNEEKSGKLPKVICLERLEGWGGLCNYNWKSKKNICKNC